MIVLPQLSCHNRLKSLNSSSVGLSRQFSAPARRAGRIRRAAGRVRPYPPSQPLLDRADTRAGSGLRPGRLPIGASRPIAAVPASTDNQRHRRQSEAFWTQRRVVPPIIRRSVVALVPGPAGDMQPARNCPQCVVKLLSRILLPRRRPEWDRLPAMQIPSLLRRTTIDDPVEDPRLVEWYRIERVPLQPRLFLQTHASRHEPRKTEGIGVGYSQPADIVRP